MNSIAREIRLAARTLMRRPSFALVVVLTLGLGIGANTALFSVMRGVLLTPLPYSDPQRLVMLWSRWKAFPDKTWVAAEEFQNYQKEVHSLSELALFDTDEAAITEGSDPERVNTALVTPNMF